MSATWAEKRAEIDNANFDEARYLRELYARVTVDAVTRREPIDKVRMWAGLSNIADSRVKEILAEHRSRELAEHQIGDQS